MSRDTPEQRPQLPLLEELAAQEHSQWSSWTQYMLDTLEGELKAKGHWGEPVMGDSPGDASQLIRNMHEAATAMSDPAGGALQLLRNLECVQRWRRQLKTDYRDLSEQEKCSDRKEVEIKFPLYKRAVFRQANAETQDPS